MFAFEFEFRPGLLFDDALRCLKVMYLNADAELPGPLLFDQDGERALRVLRRKENNSTLTALHLALTLFASIRKGPKAGKMSHLRVMQLWRRACRQLSRLGTCWSSSGKERTSRFTAAGSTAAHRPSWWSRSPNSLRLRVSGGSSQTISSQPNT